MTDPAMIETYLSKVMGRTVRIRGVERLGQPEAGEDLKGFGYGAPVRVQFELDGRQQSAVLGTMKPSPFGHDHFSDRAQVLLWEHETFNRLPRHVRSLDVGSFTKTGGMISLGEAEEFFLLTEYVEGREYYHDLERIVSDGRAAPLDFDRVRVLAEYLVSIHRMKREAPHLYVRRIRDLIGHGECIMGIIDNYPAKFGFIDPSLLEKVERECVSWRWKLKGKEYRLSQVHGDFHPWNILFREGSDFTVLDRSRGEWGEPADDLGSLSINYLFCSIRKYGRLEGDFEGLFRLFWDTYLVGSGDQEVLSVIPPFFAWRALTVASPIWYPTIPMEVRRKLFCLIRNVLKSSHFDPTRVNDYLEE